MKDKSNFLKYIGPKSSSDFSNNQASIPSKLKTYSPSPHLSSSISREKILWDFSHIRYSSFATFWKNLSQICDVPIKLINKEKILFMLKEFGGDFDHLLDEFRAVIINRNKPNLDGKNDSSEPFEQIIFEGEVCLKCKDGGSIILCDFEGCTIAYHAYCIDLENIPDKFICPAHFCQICNEKHSYKICCFCGISRCKNHSNDVKNPFINTISTEDERKINICVKCLELDFSKYNRRDFLYKLFTFNLKAGKNIKITPSVGKYEIDIPSLCFAVMKQGGLKKVIDEDKWKIIAEEITIPCSKGNFIGLRNLYYDIIYMFEKSVFRTKSNVSPSWKIK